MTLKIIESLPQKKRPYELFWNYPAFDGKFFPVFGLLKNVMFLSFVLQTRQTMQQQDINKISEELVRLFRHELFQAKRPAEDVIYDDLDLQNFLKVSRRTTAYWREKGMITFSKLGGKIYYRLSNILELIRKNEIPSVSKDLKI